MIPGWLTALGWSQSAASLAGKAVTGVAACVAATCATTVLVPALSMPWTGPASPRAIAERQAKVLHYSRRMPADVRIPVPRADFVKMVSDHGQHLFAQMSRDGTYCLTLSTNRDVLCAPEGRAPGDIKLAVATLSRTRYDVVPSVSGRLGSPRATKLSFRIRGTHARFNGTVSREGFFLAIPPRRLWSHFRTNRNIPEKIPDLIVTARDQRGNVVLHHAHSTGRQSQMSAVWTESNCENVERGVC